MVQQSIKIKGMVCNRCISTVKNELTSLGFEDVEVSLGEASFTSSGDNDIAIIKPAFKNLGLELLQDPNETICQKVRELVAIICSGDFDFPNGFRLSEYLSTQLEKSYDFLNAAFVRVEKKSIEAYFLESRISKVRELLVYTDLKLADIAFKLNFTSAAHLSNQFKQHTGLTPSYFKKTKAIRQALTRPV